MEKIKKWFILLPMARKGLVILAAVVVVAGLVSFAWWIVSAVIWKLALLAVILGLLLWGYIASRKT